MSKTLSEQLYIPQGSLVKEIKERVFMEIWINNSRVLAVLAAIVIHVATSVVLNSDLGSPYWWIANFYDATSRWCVPVFVMISGALLLNPKKSETILEFYKKRASRVLIPLMFWSAFYLSWTFLKGFIKGNTPSPQYLLLQLLSGRPYFHLWFLYMIFGLYLFTPFLRQVVRHSTKNEFVVLILSLFVLASINCVHSRLNPGSVELCINWFLSYLPYFLAGHLVQQADIHAPKWLLLILFALSVITTSIGCFILAINSGLDKGLYFYWYLSITVIPMSISIIMLLRMITNPIISIKTGKNIAQLVFGIYLVHPIFIELFTYFGITPMAFHPAFSIPTIAIGVFLLSLVTAQIIHRTPYARNII